MQITENPEEITIRHVPVREWITGGVLTFLSLVLCLFALYALFVAPRYSYAARLGELFDLVVFLLAVVLFIFLLFQIKAVRAPITTVRINNQTASADVIRQRIYGKSAVRYHFHQIEKFKSYKNKLNFSPHYFLALVLANRKTVRLKIPIGGDKLEITRLVKKLNKFVKSKSAAESP